METSFIISILYLQKLLNIIFFFRFYVAVKFHALFEFIASSEEKLFRGQLKDQ